MAFVVGDGEIGLCVDCPVSADVSSKTPEAEWIQVRFTKSSRFIISTLSTMNRSSLSRCSGSVLIVNQTRPVQVSEYYAKQ